MNAGGPASGETSSAMASSDLPITIKRYADRRLYHPAIGGYLTLGDLAAMIEDDENFVVLEAKTGEDITQSVLKQIIVERNSHG
jgi:polyhydroxyalkanoate synthesis repressor PhaR